MNKFIKLVNFEVKRNGLKGIGALIENDTKVIDLCRANTSIPSDMKTFLKGGKENISLTSTVIDNIGKLNNHIVDIKDVNIKAPIYDPEKIVCVGLNYREHAIEAKMAFPKEPIIFSKYSNCIVGDNDEILKPACTDEVDYEVELVVVIGREGKNIKVENALDYVAGYTVGNDVSARDWQLRRSGTQWTLGKVFDTFAPIGPSILVNPLLYSNHQNGNQEEVEGFNPNSLNVKCTVNGNVMQDCNTKEFIFNVQEVIAHLSQVFTLKPGDIIFTGTPSGVGFTRSPPFFLKDGDVVTCEIQHIGQLTNKVKAIP